MGCKDIPNARKNKEMLEKMRFWVRGGHFQSGQAKEYMASWLGESIQASSAAKTKWNSQIFGMK